MQAMHQQYGTVQQKHRGRKTFMKRVHVFAALFPAGSRYGPERRCPLKDEKSAFVTDHDLISHC